jgi:uncharacterized LabA/DUF88 family protein
VACAHGGTKWFKVMEEKRTDVNIAVKLVDDAYQDACDKFVIVSGDSDLVPALNCIKQRFPSKTKVVYVPALDRTRGAAVEMRAAADRDRLLPTNLMPHSLFPAVVQDGGGKQLAKPADW